MKIKMQCSQCFDEGIMEDKKKTPPFIPTYPYWEYTEVELDSWDNYYEFTCDKGHKNRFLMQIELYEMLFQQATYCINDGYYREAIGTFNTAIERFMEFSIEILFTMDIKEGVNFTEYWNLIKHQSERQIGAFYLLWSKHFKCKPDIIENKKVIDNKTYKKIRNDVIHQGYIASKEEAIEFGKITFEYLKKHRKIIDGELTNNDFLPGIRMFRMWSDKPRIKQAQEELEILQKSGEVVGISTVFVPSFLSREDLTDFNDCLNDLNEHQIGILK